MANPPSYLGAFFGHPKNMLFLTAAICAAMVASIPYGWPALTSILLIAGGVEVLGALVVPYLPSFRASVINAVDDRSRLERQNRLIQELRLRGEHKALNTFEHMSSRVKALYQTAGDSRTTLTAGDVNKLADLTVDYLNLCLVNSSLKERKAQMTDDDVRKRIAALQEQLKSQALAPEEERQIQRALAEYGESSNRARRLEIRRNTLEASLVSLPDKVEEVYQLVMSAPFSAEMSGKIEDSISRLRIAEEVSADFDSSDIFSLGPLPAIPTATPVPNAARQAARGVKN